MPAKTARQPSGAQTSTSEIKALEDHLEELRKQRMQKNVALMQKNSKLIARDAERHERFLRDFKTPEQLAAEKRELVLRQLAAMLDELVDHEDDARDMLEVEEQLESRILMQEHHLNLVCLTLAVVHSEYDRRDNQRKLLIEECNRRAKAYDKLIDTLKSQEFTARKGVEKQESNEFREFRGMWKKEAERLTLLEKQRLDVLQTEIQEQELRLQEVETNKLQQDVEQAEEALAAKLARITAKFAAMNAPLPTDA
jgi:hypothetical protein